MKVENYWRKKKNPFEDITHSASSFCYHIYQEKTIFGPRWNDRACPILFPCGNKKQVYQQLDIYYIIRLPLPSGKKLNNCFYSLVLIFQF